MDHLSIWVDFKIIWISLAKVFSRADISEEGQATMEPFNGHN